MDDSLRQLLNRDSFAAALEYMVVKYGVEEVLQELIAVCNLRMIQYDGASDELVRQWQQEAERLKLALK